MKKIMFLAMLLVGLTAAGQVRPELPWFWHSDEYQLKGQVKEVKEYYPTRYGVEELWDEELMDTHYYFRTYAEDGRVLAEYIENVDMRCHITWYWSDHLDSIVSDGDCDNYEHYYYDTDGRLTHVIHGGLVTRSRCDTTVIVYGDHGLPVATSSDWDSKHNGPWWQWDDEGCLTAYGSCYFRKDYEYDSQGRLVKSKDGDTFVSEYFYDGNGDLIKEVVQCKKPSYCGGGWTSTYRYILDSHGNWTHQYSVGEEGETLMVIRIIEYY